MPEGQPDTVSAPELNLPTQGSSPLETPATQQNPDPTPAAPPSRSKIYIGGRAFDNQDEALAWASQQVPQQPAPAKAPTEQDIDPGDILFEDPKTATRLIKEQAKAEIRREYTAAEQEKKVWNDFYVTHQDLRGYEDVVDGIKLRKWNEIANMPIDRALEILSKDARAQIQRVRGASDRQERLTDRGANTAMPSPSPAPRMPAPATKPTTLVDELKALRQKRQKVV